MSIETRESGEEKQPTGLVQTFLDAHKEFLAALGSAQWQPPSYELLGMVGRRGNIAKGCLQLVLDAGFFKDHETQDMEMAQGSFSSAVVELPAMARQINPDYRKGLKFQEGFRDDTIEKLLDPETSDITSESLGEIYSDLAAETQAALAGTDKFADFLRSEYKKAQRNEKIKNYLGIVIAAYVGTKLAQRRKK